MAQIYQIYDRIFKRIFALSNRAIINLINGLFGTGYPPDSEVFYSNKEFVGRTLKKRFADVFIAINGTSYHLEAQMTEEKRIVVRVFEYGFYYAMENMGDQDEVLNFPDPVVIYLDADTDIPEKSSLTLKFASHGTFQYEVKNFIYQEHEVGELNQKKLICCDIV